MLPHGIQLGRIPLDRVEDVVAMLIAGRIPLHLYRGRSLYSPRVQAAEIAARAATGWDEIDGLALAAVEGGRVTFSTPLGDVTVRVEEREGPAAPASCGGEPEPTVLWATSQEA